MGVKRITRLHSQLLSNPAPNIVVVTEHDYPQYSRQTFEDPLPQQTHLRCLHNSAKNTILHPDHIEKVENNGNSYP